MLPFRPPPPAPLICTGEHIHGYMNNLSLDVLIQVQAVPPLIKYYLLFCRPTGLPEISRLKSASVVNFFLGCDAVASFL